MIGPMLSTAVEALFVSALMFPIYPIMKLPVSRVVTGMAVVVVIVVTMGKGRADRKAESHGSCQQQSLRSNHFLSPCAPRLGAVPPDRLPGSAYLTRMDLNGGESACSPAVYEIAAKS